VFPSKEAQEALIRKAYDESGCDPAVVGYFEAHGTGTQAGDPIEAGAIGATLGKLGLMVKMASCLLEASKQTSAIWRVAVGWRVSLKPS